MPQLSSSVTALMLAQPNKYLTTITKRKSRNILLCLLYIHVDMRAVYLSNLSIYLSIYHLFISSSFLPITSKGDLELR